MALSVDRHREALLHRLASRVEPAHAFGDLLVGDHEGRQDAHDIVAGGNKEKLVSERGVSESGWRDLQLEADDEPLAPNPLDPPVMPILDPPQPLAHVQAEPRDSL